MSFQIQKTWRVGIDLGPAGMGRRAPGTARHVTEQARALFKLDVPWEWVPLVEAESNPLYEEMREQGLNPIVVPGHKVAARATFAVGRAWEEKRCDLGFATAYFVPWRGGKVVANFFDSNAYEYGWTWIKTGLRWNHYLNRTLSTWCVWRAERLFVNSQYCVDVLRKKFPVQAGKFRVTSPGVLPPMDGTADVKPAILADIVKPHCLFIGIFSENKNQRRLIEAWARWQQSDPESPALVLVGGCDPDYLDSMILPARQRAPRPEEIVLTGFLRDEEVSWCYRHASVYVQPAFAEGFGLPVIEAMSYGLPVASSSTTSLPEVGGDAAVYFDPASVESMLEVIRELWGNQEKRRLLIERGGERPRQFTWEKNAQAVASQIEEVLAQSRGPTLKPTPIPNS
jgi:glycosyltransferase involved in cell wall biosynthesis